MSFITFSNPVMRKADKPSVDLLNSIYSGASPYLGPKVILTHTHTHPTMETCPTVELLSEVNL